MVIPNYFDYVIREDESFSTCPEEENADTSESEAKVEPSSLYSVIGKACLACARPPIDLVDDNNSATDGITEDVNVPIFKSFSFGEIEKATGNFRPDRFLAEGDLGKVFKGWIDEHTLEARKPGTGVAIAVKWSAQQGLKGQEEWLGKVNYVGKLNHPNLMSLVGYCLENEHRLLVCEFMSQGSLKDLLCEGGFHNISWSLRMKIALGAAKALAFLHNAETKVIYGDFKSSNILLDSDYLPKLSYCGLVKDARVVRRLVETRFADYFIGDVYADPSGGMSTKSDVYSYGVVLLEIICGRLADDDTMPDRERDLLQWTESYLYYDYAI